MWLKAKTWMAGWGLAGLIGGGALTGCGVVNNSSPEQTGQPTGQHQVFTPQSGTSGTNSSASRNEPSATTGCTVQINEKQFNNASVSEIAGWLRSNPPQDMNITGCNTAEAASLLGGLMNQVVLAKEATINITPTDTLTVLGMEGTADIQTYSNITYGQMQTLHNVATQTNGKVILNIDMSPASSLGGQPLSGTPIELDIVSIGSGVQALGAPGPALTATQAWAVQALGNPAGYSPDTTVVNLHNMETGKDIPLPKPVGAKALQGVSVQTAPPSTGYGPTSIPGQQQSGKGNGGIAAG